MKMHPTLHALLASAVLVTSSSAQGESTPPDRVAWQGGVVSIQSQFDVQKKVADHRARLADLRVKLLGGGAADAEALAWIDDIRWYASSQVELPQQVTLMVEVALTRSAVLEGLGRYDEARAALDEILYVAGDPRAAARSDAAPASGKILLVADAARKDPRLEEQRSELAARTEKDPGEELLEAKLRDAMARGDWGLVSEVGYRALPVLQEKTLAGMSDFPQVSGMDPLHYMILISSHDAARFALEHLDDSGFIFQRRLVRAVFSTNVFHPSLGNWGERSSESTPVPFLVPEWLDVLASLVENPELAGEAMPLLGQVMVSDGVTPKITAAVKRLLEARPDSAVMIHKELVRTESKLGSAKEICEALLACPHSATRRYAASRLLSFNRNHALWGYAEDPDHLIREIVARSIKRERRNGITVVPVIDDTSLGALRKLLQDPAEDIRRSAASSLLGLTEPLEPELYLAIADDPSPKVRALMAFARNVAPELQAQLLDRLSNDASQEVLDAVDGRLQDTDTWTRVEVALPAARKRLLQVLGDDRRVLVNRLAQSEPGFFILLEAALEYPDDSLMREVWSQRNNLSTSTGRYANSFLALDDEQLTATYLRFANDDAIAFEELFSALNEAKTPRWNAMLSVVEAPSAPTQARLNAASYAANGGGDRFRKAALDLLSTGELAGRDLSDAEWNIARRMMFNLPEADRNPLVLAALQAPGVRDDTCARIAAHYVPSAPGGERVTSSVLERWTDRPLPSAADAVEHALFHLRTLEHPERDAILERAVRHPAYSRSALETMGALRNERFLPVIQAALAADWVQNSANRWNVRSAAVDALTAFPGDAATEILLETMATSPDSKTRGACQNALAIRRVAREERRSWELSKQARLGDEDAVARLVELLGDQEPTIRAEAARGLATLRAVEALPILIGALRDEDEGVRKAVRAALDRLHELAGADGAGGSK